jgi:hypothetical protein
MAFEIYIPSSLAFQDYIGISQCARTLADGYDRKVSLSKLNTLECCHSYRIIARINPASELL